MSNEIKLSLDSSAKIIPWNSENHILVVKNVSDKTTIKIWGDNNIKKLRDFLNENYP